MKIPPRHVFISQLCAQIIAVAVCYWAIRDWLSNPDHITWIKKNGHVPGSGATWGATSPNLFYNASLIWGAVGPIRFFFESSYASLLYGGLIIGTMTPILCKLGSHLLGPIFPWALVSPLIFTQMDPGQNQGYMTSSFFVSWFFQVRAYPFLFYLIVFLCPFFQIPCCLGPCS
jgi:hypothetical protein